MRFLDELFCNSHFPSLVDLSFQTNATNKFTLIAISSLLMDRNGSQRNELLSALVEFTLNGAASISCFLSLQIIVSLHKSYILAHNADMININCASNKKRFACYSNIWYLTDNETIFNCYGTGCNDLGILYLYNESLYNQSSIQYNINGCNQCDKINDCIDADIIYINKTITPNINITQPNINSIYNYSNTIAKDSNDNDIFINCTELQQIYGYMDCDKIKDLITSPSYSPTLQPTILIDNVSRLDE